MTHGSLFSGIGGFELAAAIVPQVAYRIFESIQDHEKRKKSTPSREELSPHHRE